MLSRSRFERRVILREKREREGEGGESTCEARSVVHFVHLANLVMRWLLQITDAQSTHKHITCSMFRTFFRLAFRFAAALSLATFCDTAASSAADKGECALKDCDASNVTGSGDDSGDWLRLCVCERARHIS
jgi:hypothetical protein